MKRFWLFSLVTALAAAVLTAPSVVRADGMDDVNEGMGILSQKLSSIEKELGIKTKGDIRFRWENQMQGEDGPLPSSHRFRTRVRARLEVSKKVSDEVKGYIKLATGGSEPTSTNQTLDKDATPKGIYLDRAAIEYSPFWADGKLTLIGGKMANPLKGTAITWDGDVNPEGIGIKVDANQTHFNFLYFILQENSTKSEAYLVAAQLAEDFKAGDADCTFLVGGEVVPNVYDTYYHDPGYTTWKSPLQQGMIMDATSTVAGGIPDLVLAEGMLTIKHKVQKVPVSWTFHVVYNTNSFEINPTTVPGATETAGNALAFLGKVGVGKASPGMWAGGLEFGSIEPNAVYGLFSDSDRGYNNRVWVKGNVAVGIATDMVFEVTHFMEWRQNYDITGGNMQPVHLTQIDTVVKL